MCFFLVCWVGKKNLETRRGSEDQNIKVGRSVWQEIGGYVSDIIGAPPTRVGRTWSCTCTSPEPEGAGGYVPMTLRWFHWLHSTHHLRKEGSIPPGAPACHYVRGLSERARNAADHWHRAG